MAGPGDVARATPAARTTEPRPRGVGYDGGRRGPDALERPSSTSPRRRWSSSAGAPIGGTSGAGAMALPYRRWRTRSSRAGACQHPAVGRVRPHRLHRARSSPERRRSSSRLCRRGCPTGYVAISRIACARPSTCPSSTLLLMPTLGPDDPHPQDPQGRVVGAAEHRDEVDRGRQVGEQQPEAPGDGIGSRDRGCVASACSLAAGLRAARVRGSSAAPAAGSRHAGGSPSSAGSRKSPGSGRSVATICAMSW